MASAFGHAVTAVALGNMYPERMVSWKFWVLGAICAIMPDADVVAFAFDIPYDHRWGHRGFTHSLLFALITGIVVTFLFFRNNLNTKMALGFILYFTLCTASHGILDAMTTGGRGVAFFSPWNDARYFLPWRPIAVSPIGVGNFFSEWGRRVVLNELVWIGIPSMVFVVLGKIVKRRT